MGDDLPLWPCAGDTSFALGPAYGYASLPERPLGEIQLKSQIARPRVYEVLSPGSPTRVCGAAWAGETAVTEIAVSTDGGQTWTEAQWVDPVTQYAWRRWQ